jgi:hypothetical protein
MSSGTPSASQRLLDELLSVDPRNLSGKVKFDRSQRKGYGAYGDVYIGAYRVGVSTLATA